MNQEKPRVELVIARVLANLLINEVWPRIKKQPAKYSPEEIAYIVGPLACKKVAGELSTHQIREEMDRIFDF